MEGDVIDLWAAEKNKRGYQREGQRGHSDLGQVTTFSGPQFPHLSNEELENL